jgi:hypothetical protein
LTLELQSNLIRKERIKTLELEATRPEACPLRQPGTMAGIQPEQEQEQESHVLPSGFPHPEASNSEPNPPSTPLSKIPALTPDKTPATSCNLLSWFRHPLATFTASLKRRRCASSGDNPKAGRKKKVEILGDACADDEAAKAKARQEKKAPGSDPELLAESIPKAIGATTTAHNVDYLNDDDDVYVKKVATLHPFHVRLCEGEGDIYSFL